MKIKGLMNLLPLGVIAVLGYISWQSWQQAQPPRVDYDNPTPPQAQPGIIQASADSGIAQSEYWQVVSVTDGDTLVVRRGMREDRIRLCGIDAPESSQPFGTAAADLLRQRVSQAGDQVAIVPVERDRYDRQVAEVFSIAQDGTEQFLQQELLTAGMAYVYPQYVEGCPNGEAMKLAEAIAQDARVGVWSGSYQRPWDYRRAN